MNDGITKLLNPLADGSRYLNDPVLGKVKIHPSVLIIGLMNPETYRGTQKLPQEFRSRARIESDKYPYEQEEAFMYSKYALPAVAKLSESEFAVLWDRYIVRDEVPNDQSLYTVFKVLHKVTKVANKMREVYIKTMNNELAFDEEMELIFTLREGIFTLQDYNHTGDIVASLKDVVLNKISDKKQKEVAAAIIDQQCA
ncbi:MAG: hypothetical protein H6765_10925 [Candidatus Peribacteria bacterium]|nr:MAG: hypothetical protein H6765_10925 [Candidatus Peribacteria bacterium]